VASAREEQAGDGEIFKNSNPAQPLKKGYIIEKKMHKIINTFWRISTSFC